ncbi:hypothetical protein ACVWYH_000189 [Bradyrhizobium sp. GM24.11]
MRDQFPDCASLDPGYKLSIRETLVRYALATTARNDITMIQFVNSLHRRNSGVRSWLMI